MLNQFELQKEITELRQDVESYEGVVTSNWDVIQSKPLEEVALLYGRHEVMEEKLAVLKSRLYELEQQLLAS